MVPKRSSTVSQKVESETSKMFGKFAKPNSFLNYSYPGRRHAYGQGKNLFVSKSNSSVDSLLSNVQELSQEATSLRVGGWEEKFSIRLNRLASYSIKLIEGPLTLAFSHEKWDDECIQGCSWFVSCTLYSRQTQFASQFFRVETWRDQTAFAGRAESLLSRQGETPSLCREVRNHYSRDRGKLRASSSASWMPSHFSSIFHV